MRKTICVLAGLILFIAVQGQKTSNGISVIKGERFNVIQSLKDLKPDPLLNPRVTRDLNGSLIKKTWKDTIIDYGTKASGDPVVQKVPFLPKNLLSELKFTDEEKKEIFRNFENSMSQNYQDLAALKYSGFKQGGFFVEFGACDGIKLSNSFLLEKEYGWKGILAEPVKDWQSDLEMNRSARIFNLAVTNRSNDRIEMLVSESLEVSSLAEFNEDYLSDYRSKHSRVEYVETISLNDLLLQGNAPNDIDFLSIDTEGNEFQILESFNFEGYSFAFISIEHNNNNNNRNRIQELLESKGYEKVHQNISSVDDWYVPNPLSKIMPKTF